MNEVRDQNPLESASVPTIRGKVENGIAELDISFPRKPIYTSALIQNRLIVSFNEAVAVDQKLIMQNMSGFVKTIELRNEGRVFVFELEDGVKSQIKSTAQGIAIFFEGGKAASSVPEVKVHETPKDPVKEAQNQNTKSSQGIETASQESIGTTPAAKLKEKAPQEVSQIEAIQVKARMNERFERLIFEWPFSVDYKLYQDGKQTIIVFSNLGKFDFSEIKYTPLNLISHVEQAALEQQVMVRLFTPDVNRVESFRNNNSIVLDVFYELRNPELSFVTTDPIPQFPDKTWDGNDLLDPAGSQQTDQAGQDGSESQKANVNYVDFDATNYQLSSKFIKIKPKAPIQIAAFQRGAHYYIFCDQKLEGDPLSYVDAGEKVIKKVDVVPHPENTVFRIKDFQSTVPFVNKTGEEWIIDLSPMSLVRKTPLEVEAQPDFSLGSRLLVKLNDKPQIFSFTDPEVQDQLYIVTFANPSQSLQDSYKYSQLEILPADQGIVVKPWSSEVSARPVDGGLEVTARGGLVMTQLADLSKVFVNDALEEKDIKPIFEFSSWARGGYSSYTKDEQALLKEIIDSPPEKLGHARLNLAKFYMGHGFGHEASQVLSVVEKDQPALSTHPEFKALSGAAHVLGYHDKQAWRELNDPEIRDNVEIGLWLGAITDNAYYASELFYKATVILDTYPEPLKMFIVQRAIDSLLAVDSIHLAETYIEYLQKASRKNKKYVPAYAYYKGALLKAQDQMKDAKRYFEFNQASQDRYYRARSKLALIDVDQSLAPLSHKELVNRLEELTFAWRDEDYEIEVLRRLFDAYLLDKKYLNALKMGKSMIALFPDELEVKYLPSKISNLYEDLLLNYEQYPITAIDAYKIYDSFSELTPQGDKGDQIILNLADRLIEIEMTDKAIEMLDHLVKYRLSSHRKVKVGFKLATLYLLNNQASASFDTLKYLDEFVKAAKIELAPQDVLEKKYLQAKANVSLKKYAEALSLLQSDNSMEATMLKYDIAWAVKDWEQASFYLAQLIGDPSEYVKGQALDDFAKDLILRRALCLSLQNDTQALSVLKENFGDLMKNSQEFEKFNLLTMPQDYASIKNAVDIKNKIAKVDLFDSVLKTYKKNIKELPK